MLLKGSAKDLGHSMQEIDHRTKKAGQSTWIRFLSFLEGADWGGLFLVYIHHYSDYACSQLQLLFSPSAVRNSSALSKAKSHTNLFMILLFRMRSKTDALRELCSASCAAGE